METSEILSSVTENIKHFINKNPKGIVIIRGATATGKSGLSIKLANYFPIEIISCDSRQIYKYMNIGTDKVSTEIRKNIPHHTIDFLEPDKTYSTGEWKKEVEKLIPLIQSKGKIPIITGGTGLYIDSIYKNFEMPKVKADFDFRNKLEEIEKEKPGELYQMLSKIDPIEAGKIHPNSLRYIIRALEIFEKTGQKKSLVATENPVKWPIFMIGLWREKEDTNNRINKRIDEMIDGGLIQEVKRLLNNGYNESHQAMNGIGYKEIIGYIKGIYDLENAKYKLQINTHRFAKRQRTWFRRYLNDAKNNPKMGVEYITYNLTNGKIIKS